MRENRELGENPGRTHHCKEETYTLPLGNWETGKAYRVDDSKSGDLPVTYASHELR